MVAWGLEWSFSTKTPWKLINIQTPARALLSPRHSMHFLTINESLYCSVSLALQRTPLIPKKKPSLATGPGGTLSDHKHNTRARRFRVGGNLQTKWWTLQVNASSRCITNIYERVNEFVREWNEKKRTRVAKALEEASTASVSCAPVRADFRPALSRHWLWMASLGRNSHDASGRFPAIFSILFFGMNFYKRKPSPYLSR